MQKRHEKVKSIRDLNEALDCDKNNFVSVNGLLRHSYYITYADADKGYDILDLASDDEYTISFDDFKEDYIYTCMTQGRFFVDLF